MKLAPGTYRCISVWQPWAWAIFHGKGIENRRRPFRYRGRLLIHASKTTRDVASVLELLNVRHKLAVPDDLAFGAIIGMVEVFDCKYSAVESPCGWGVADAFHWHLRDQQLLDEPIPFTGRQGVFFYHHPFSPILDANGNPKPLEL
ncbi:MAG TPA: hypothetical protein VH413_16115 [Verrucomicrobiae bacterium]|jgi:hypothetical protein|nr:hypothetical protein [Verrucomicrobiae bacterium]